MASQIDKKHRNDLRREDRRREDRRREDRRGDDRRGASRQSGLMSARIVMPEQKSFAPCLVRDVSQTGAKLIMDDCWLIPRAFWLRIDDDPFLRYYTVVWRSAGEIGIELVSKTKKRSWTSNWSDLLR